MPITPSSATVTVSDSGSLRDAYNTLSKSGGGTIEVTQGTRPIEIALSGGGTDHVNIVSADDSAPTLLHRISFSNVENVTVSDFRIDSTGVTRPDWHMDLMVNGGGNIAIEDSAFTSNAVGRYSPNDADTVLGESLALVRYTTDFTFENNTVADYYHGLAIRETKGASVTGNEFSGLQGDGLRLAGVQQTEVSGNYMHDFLGTTRTFNHNDFIQLWSNKTNLLTKDLTISGNTLDSGDGSAAQAIFLGNERIRQGDSNYRYQNIDIFDNLIHSGNIHGITVSGADDVNVANNTVLWNVTAEIVDRVGDSGRNDAPRIRFIMSRTASSSIISPKGSMRAVIPVVTGNEILNYSRPGDANYVGANFVDALGGGGGLDFRLLSDSAWDGLKGAVQTWSGSAAVPATPTPTPEEEPEVEEVANPEEAPDAGEMPVPDVTPEPEKPDVPEAEELPETEGDLPPDVAPTAPATNDGRIVADIDFETTAPKGLLDRFDSSALLQSGTNSSYAIGEESTLQIDRRMDALHGLEAFSLEMDVTADTDDLSGALVHFYKAFEVTTARDGSLRFKLETDEGTFYAGTDGNPLSDGEKHRLGVSYDDDLGRMSLRVDDVVVAESEASGVTADRTYHGLTLGHSWAEKGATPSPCLWMSLCCVLAFPTT